MFIKSVQQTEEGKKYYSQHDFRVIIVVNILNFMIIEVKSRFIVYELVNFISRVGCDNLSAPKNIRGASLA